jgi:hypothetical protein
MHDDWYTERVVFAIRSAAESPGEPAVADALGTAIAKQQGRERAVARKRKQNEEEAARRQEEDGVLSALQVELRALRDNSPGMVMLTAVEYVTADPGHRIVLYRHCSAQDRSVNGMAQNNLGLFEGRFVGGQGSRVT